MVLHLNGSGCADVDGDGRLDLLAGLSAMGPALRGLCCFALSRQTRKWAFTTAFPGFCPGRQDRQVRNDLVTGSNPEERGTTFLHDPTVLVLDQDLDERAAYAVPGPASRDGWKLVLADIEGDGTQEILWLDRSLRILSPRGWW